MFPRSSEEFRSQERRRGLIFVAVGIGLIYLILTALSSVWTDFLWFDSLGFLSVWRVNVFVSLGLGAAGVVLVFGFVYLNLVITDRLSPSFASLELTEEEELVERFREWAAPRMGWLRTGVALAFALLLGSPAGEWRAQFLQFMNPTRFGIADPQFDTDIAFYMFRLPFWTLLVNWAFNVVALTVVLVVALHYLNGGIRFQRGSRPSVRSGVKTHVSALAALLALLRAVGYQIDRFELLYNQQPAFFGAGFTDITARLPALQLLTLVSLAAAVLFLWNIRRPGWTLAFVSVGAWVFVSIAAGAIYPALVQRFRVDPQELQQERQYIERNLEFTKAAYGLTDVQRRDYPATRDLEWSDIEENEQTVRNLRLWDPDVLQRTYRVLQEIRPYYTVEEVDTDRYEIDGETTQVLISAREMDEEGLPEQNWQTVRLIYTHGFGAALSTANNIESDGQPDLLVRDVPPTSSVFELDQTRVYFGETYSPGYYVVVKTGSAPQEADFPLEQSFARYEYQGDAGVPLDNIFKRLAFALRFRDLNLLISSELRPDSRLLMERNINEIVTRVAPFLASDADPYPVLIDGRIKWIVDMYTWSSAYPYSKPWGPDETARVQRSATGVPPRGGNYIRNSVRAVVDAYDGGVEFYVTDDFQPDPLVETWQKAYPELFIDESEMDPELKEHWRYPQDMFRIQTEIYRTYHQDSPDDLFTGVDAWSIAPDPSTQLADADPLYGDSLTETGATQSPDGVLPYYVQFPLPGDETDEPAYMLMQPFNTQARPNMSAFLVADSTPETFGRLVDFRMPQDQVVDGTGQVGQRIQQDQEIAQQFTLWDQRGASVIRGDMLVVPIADSLLYVQPVYLEAEAGGLPEFRRVIVAYGDRIEWDFSLEVAIAEALGVEPPSDAPAAPDEEPPPEDDEVDPGDQALADNVVELLADAATAFEDAEEALRAGDLAEYQARVDDAQRLVEEAARLAGLDETEAAALVRPVGLATG